MPNEIKLIVFDLNKTLIKQDSWYDLNLALGMTPKEDQDLFDLYSAGKLSYKKWIALLFKTYLLRGTPRKTHVEKTLHNYRYLRGAKQTIKYLQRKGYQVAIISGAMDSIVKKVAVDLNIPQELALANNTFHYNKGALVKIETIGDDPVAKLKMLRKICKNLKISTKSCAAVGDGDNDYSLFIETRRGITFTNSKISKSAWKTIEELGDLKQIF